MKITGLIQRKLIYVKVNQLTLKIKNEIKDIDMIHYINQKFRIKGVQQRMEEYIYKFNTREGSAYHLFNSTFIKHNCIYYQNEESSFADTQDQLSVLKMLLDIAEDSLCNDHFVIKSFFYILNYKLKDKLRLSQILDLYEEFNSKGNLRDSMFRSMILEFAGNSITGMDFDKITEGDLRCLKSLVHIEEVNLIISNYLDDLVYIDNDTIRGRLEEFREILNDKL